MLPLYLYPCGSSGHQRVKIESPCSVWYGSWTTAKRHAHVRCQYSIVTRAASLTSLYYRSVDHVSVTWMCVRVRGRRRLCTIKTYVSVLTLVGPRALCQRTQRSSVTAHNQSWVSLSSLPTRCPSSHLPAVPGVARRIVA